MGDRIQSMWNSPHSSFSPHCGVISPHSIMGSHFSTLWSHFSIMWSHFSIMWSNFSTMLRNSIMWSNFSTMKICWSNANPENIKLLTDWLRMQRLLHHSSSTSLFIRSCLVIDFVSLSSIPSRPQTLLTLHLLSFGLSESTGVTQTSARGLSWLVRLYRWNCHLRLQTHPH